MANGPARGRLYFWDPCFWSHFFLHPSAALALWFAAVVAVQYLDYPGLAVVAVVLLAIPGVLRPWFGFVRRARWLLLTLWLILAYNTPGEAYADMAWAPTYEGLAEASLHAVRLVVMLECLAWLFARLGRAGLLAGLWRLLQPCRRLGLDSERLVVRLSLVLENLQREQEKGAWRRVLAAAPDFAQGPEVVHLTAAVWQARDSLLVGLSLCCLIGVVMS